MDLYDSTVRHLLTLPAVREWPELTELIRRMASLEPRDWGLPLKACLAAGGSFDEAIPAAGAIACAQMGVIMIDDMLDEDPRGEYHRLGEAQTANYAAALLGTASESLLQGGASPRARLAALESLNLMLVTLSFGQYLDVKNPPDEDAYWQAVEMKSGYFFKTALELGVLCGGASAEAAANVGRVGLYYGQMIQIHDDLGDAMTSPPGPDWLQARASLPILFAETVDHPERPRFLELRGHISEGEALAEAQGILIRCGAVSYCLDQLMQRHRAAAEILGAVDLPRREHLEELLEDAIAPARKLLQASEPMK